MLLSMVLHRLWLLVVLFPFVKVWSSHCYFSIGKVYKDCLVAYFGLPPFRNYSLVWRLTHISLGSTTSCCDHSILFLVLKTQKTDNFVGWTSFRTSDLNPQLVSIEIHDLNRVKMSVTTKMCRDVGPKSQGNNHCLNTKLCAVSLT